MRKIKGAMTLIFTLAGAAVLLASTAALPKRLAFSGGENYCFYVGNTSKNCREVDCTPQRAPALRLTLKDVCGESVTYKSLDVGSFLAQTGAKIIFCEELSDSVNYYCRAPLPYSVTLYGEQINLHVSVRDDGVRVASPIIFGGY